MNKYRNIKVEVDGLKFDSRKEANYYGVLKMRKLAGEIDEIKCHFKWPLVVNGDFIGNYICDFYVIYPNGLADTIDVKGVKTTAYQLKKKLMKALYNITIKEV